MTVYPTGRDTREPARHPGLVIHFGLDRPSPHSLAWEFDMGRADDWRSSLTMTGHLRDALDAEAGLTRDRPVCPDCGADCGLLPCAATETCQRCAS